MLNKKYEELFFLFVLVKHLKAYDEILLTFLKNEMFDQ